MGIFDVILESIKTWGGLSDAAEKHYEPQLKALGLGKEDVQHQTLQELEQSLAKVDDAISRKESFASVRLMATADGKIVVSTTKEGFEINIRPTLLARKALIVERMRQLRTIESVGTLRNLVEANVAEPAKAKLIEKIETVEREAAEWREKA